MSDDLLLLAAELRRRGEPFALATVVRCEPPTSAKPGAKALVRGDGTVTGWVGGACAEPVVIREALEALKDGRSRLVGLVGEGGRDPERTEGILHLPMTCHSGGTLEIYVEPYLPKTLLLLIGHGPVVETLAALGRTTDYAVTVLPADRAARDLHALALTASSAVVVATHGDLDEAALAEVLGTPAGYVSVVASRHRIAVILESLERLGVSRARPAEIKAPAGLDIGAVTPEEIAVSILAEIIQWRRRRAPGAAVPTPSREGVSGLRMTALAKDPVCGMSVQIEAARYRSEWAGATVYFCCHRCKETFDSDPPRHAAALVG
jgi:xanthine dehydrogenase accessory factor